MIGGAYLGLYAVSAALLVPSGPDPKVVVGGTRVSQAVVRAPGVIQPATGIALVASVSAIRGGPSAAINTTGATLLVTSTGNYSADATFADNKGNTWIGLTTHIGGSGYHRIYYCLNPIVGAGHTFTVSGSYAGCIVYAFSGVASYQSESGAGVNGNLSPLACGPVTPLADGALVFTGLTANTFAVDTVTPAGFTKTQLDNGPGVNLQQSAAYLIQATAATIDPTWAWSGGSHDYTGVSAAVFLAAVTPAPPGGPLTRIQGTGKVVADSATSIALTFPTAPSVGNAVVVAVATNNAGGVSLPSCTDNRGNRYLRVKTQSSPNNDSTVAVFVCPRIAVTSAPFTLTVLASGNTWLVGSATEVGGVGNGLIAHRSVSQSGSTAAVTTGTTAPLAVAVDEVFLLAVHSIDGAQSSIAAETVTPPWTTEAEELSFSHAVGEIDSRVVTGGIGTTASCNWADASAFSWAAALVVFKPGGTPTLLASVGKAAAGTTAPINTTEATLLVAWTSNWSTPGVLTDSAGNAWVPLSQAIWGGSGAGRLYYCEQPVTSAAHTFSFTGSDATWYVLAFADVLTFSGVQSVASSVTPPCSAGAIAPLEAGALLVAAMGNSHEVMADRAIGGGFTLVGDIDGASGSNQGLGVAYLAQVGGPSSVNPQWTGTAGGGHCGCAIAAFGLLAAANPTKLAQLPVEVLVLDSAPLFHRLAQAPVEVLLATDLSLVDLRVAQAPVEVLVDTVLSTELRLAQAAVEVLVKDPPYTTVPVRLAQTAVEVLAQATGPIDTKLVQLPVEVLRSETTPEPNPAQLDQLPVEVLISVDVPNLVGPRVSHFAVETIAIPPTPPARLGQIVIETLIVPLLPSGRIGQFVVETLYILPPPARVSQAIVETLTQAAEPVARLGHFIVEVLSVPPGLKTFPIPEGAVLFPPQLLGGDQGIVTPPRDVSHVELFPPEVYPGPVEVVGAHIDERDINDLFPPHVLHDDPKVTAAGAEVYGEGEPHTRVTQSGVDFIELGDSLSRVTHVGADQTVTLVPFGRFTGAGAEVIYALPIPGRFTHAGVEIVWIVPRPEVLLSNLALTWVEFTDRANVMRPWSSVALPDPLGYYGGFKEPRVIQWGRIVRALSEIRSGQLEGMEFTVTLSDDDRVIRTLLSQKTTKYFVNRPLVVRMIDDDRRRAQDVPRTVMRGLISAYQPQPQLQFQMTAQDVMSRKFAQAQGGVTIPKRVVTLEHFPNCNQIVPNFQPGGGIPQTIGARGKGVPIIYGRVSDQKLSTIVDPVATVPPFDPDPAFEQGAQFANDIAGGILNGGVGGYILPYRAGMVGRIRGFMAGTVDYNRSVSFRWKPVEGAEKYVLFISDGGGWVPGYPPPPYMTFGRMLEHDLTQELPDDAEAPFQLIFGSPTEGVDIMTPDPGGTSHVVDEGKGQIKPIYVGDAAFAGENWRVGLVCGHAIKGILGGYLNDVAVDLTTNPEWLTPVNWAWWTSMGGSFGWDWSKPYLDIGGHRYTLIFLRGLAGDTFAGVISPAEGSPGITLNLDGIETEGDGTGTLITDIHQQYKHLMKNWVLGNYTSGAWLFAPLYPDSDDMPQLDEQSFNDVTSIALERLASGYKGAGVIGIDGETLGVRDLIAQWNQSADTDCGFNRHGQFFVTMIPNLGGLSSQLLTDVHDVLKDSFQIVDDLSSHFNNMPWSYEREYSGRASAEHANNFRQTGEMSDDESIANYEARLRSPEVALEYVRDEATAMDIVQRRLLRMKDPPRQATFSIGLEGANLELGDIINLTHFGGIGPSGWVGQPVRINRHEFDPNTMITVLTCEDMRPFLSTVFILGDETVLAPSWASAPPQDRVYGYLADEDTDDFSDGMPGKRLR